MLLMLLLALGASTDGSGLVACKQPSSTKNALAAGAMLDFCHSWLTFQWTVNGLVRYALQNFPWELSSGTVVNAL
jgi:hypothetical protein